MRQEEEDSREERGRGSVRQKGRKGLTEGSRAAEKEGSPLGGGTRRRGMAGIGDRSSGVLRCGKLGDF